MYCVLCVVVFFLVLALKSLEIVLRVRVALWNGEVVFCSPNEGKLCLASVKYEEIWKEN